MRSRGRDGAAVAVLVGVCVAFFHRPLSWWFTGPDTASLIRSSRVDNAGDAVGFFAQPLMSGTSFTDLALFYRPVTHLSFAFDHALWGLDPFGYHLTNLVLHTTVTVLVYAVAWSLTGGAQGRSLVAAAFFAVHPVVAESVPAISRRQDALSVLFLLGAFLAFLKTRDADGRAWGWWGASVVLALLAYGSKEAALALMGVVFAFAWIVGEEGPARRAWGARTRWALARAGPFIVLGLGFLAWRTVVLGGFGGYPDRPAYVSWVTAWEVSQYVTALVSPLRFVQASLELKAQGVGVLLAIVGGLVGGLVWFLYRGEGVSLRRDVGTYAGTRSGRAVAFCLAWIGVGLGLFVSARTFDDWSAYQFVVPLAVGVSVLLGDGVWSLTSRGSGGSSSRVGNTAAIVGVVVVAGGLIVVTVGFSPSVHGYEEWGANARMQETLLPGFVEAIEEAPGPVSTVRVHDVAWSDQTRAGEVDRLHTVFYFQAFTFEDWFALQEGTRGDVSVTINNSIELERAPSSVGLRRGSVDDGSVDVYVEYLD